MHIHAAYFDGKTSRRHQVVLTVEGDVACISGEADRRCPLSQLRVSEASQHGMRLVTFPDGAYLEIGDQQGFARMLSATGHTDSLVSRLQQSWRATLLAALAMAAIIVLLWRLVLPLAADLIASMLPCMHAPLKWLVHQAVHTCKSSDRNTPDQRRTKFAMRRSTCCIICSR